MNTAVYSTVAVALGVLLAQSPRQANRSAGPPAGEALVVVSVTGLERDEGSVRFALFDGPDGFTEEPSVAGVVTPVDRSATWSVRVPPGVYAVAVIHDADDNGRLNTNFLGMPRERYGFSNDARGTFGPPSFEDASFVVAGDTVPVAVRVR